MSGWCRGMALAGLLAVCALPLCAQDGDDVLRVMSFNVRLGVADDGDDSWEHRKRQASSSVLGIQPSRSSSPATRKSSTALRQARCGR